jgi:hypothetical protein
VGILGRSGRCAKVSPSPFFGVEGQQIGVSLQAGFHGVGFERCAIERVAPEPHHLVLERAPLMPRPVASSMSGASSTSSTTAPRAGLTGRVCTSAHLMGIDLSRASTDSSAFTADSQLGLA